MNRNILAIIALLLLVVIGVLVWNMSENADNQNGGGNGGDVIDNQDDDTEEIEDTDADGREDDTQEDDPVVSDEGNIKVSLPVKRQRVGAHSLVIVGEARVFENNVQWRVKDEDGNVLDSGYATANAPDIGQFGPFVIYATYLADAGTNGTVEVYNESARDGSEENVVTIPVRFAREKTAQIYLANAEMAGEGDECSEVFAVDRLVVDGPPAVRLRNALWILLAGGATGEEGADGYSSSIPDGVRVNDLNVNEYGAKVSIDLSGEIEAGGSCRVASIREQIEETVKGIMGNEFSVEITVNGGNPDEALQP